MKVDGLLFGSAEIWTQRLSGQAKPVVWLALHSEDLEGPVAEIIFFSPSAARQLAQALNESADRADANIEDVR